jgi:adenosylcobinamide-GDP ribazoletransferase
VRAALAFLTPLGGARNPTPAAMRWFPVVGLLLGLAVGGIWWGADQLWPWPVAAAIAVAADLALTGMLHLDGLVDSADGLIPHLDRERRLEVMADPRAGAFGVLVAGGTLLTRWAAFGATDANVLLVAGLWCLSRSAMGALLVSLPYARLQGLASPFAGAATWPVLSGAVFSGLLLGRAIGWPALAVFAGAWLVVAAMGVVAKNRLGGFTGDVLGAAGVLAETVGLVIASAKW